MSTEDEIIKYPPLIFSNKPVKGRRVFMSCCGRNGYFDISGIWVGGFGGAITIVPVSQARKQLLKCHIDIPRDPGTLRRIAARLNELAAEAEREGETHGIKVQTGGDPG